MNRILTDPPVLDWLGGPATTAVYASAGGDTRALVFTHPQFLAHRGMPPAAAPNLFVFLDRDPQRRPRFDDGHTMLSVEHEANATVAGLPGRVHLVQYRPGPDDQRGFSPRNLVLLAVRTTNEEASARMHGTGWVPDVFIGISDGCRSGGNDHCVNRLARWGGAPDTAARVPVPRWWITDHLENAIAGGQEPGGRSMDAEGCFHSADPTFPFRLVKRGLLSTRWGHYRSPGISGATLFEVTRTAGGPGPANVKR